MPSSPHALLLFVLHEQDLRRLVSLLGFDLLEVQDGLTCEPLAPFVLVPGVPVLVVLDRDLLIRLLLHFLLFDQVVHCGAVVQHLLPQLVWLLLGRVRLFDLGHGRGALLQQQHFAKIPLLLLQRVLQHRSYVEFLGASAFPGSTEYLVLALGELVIDSPAGIAVDLVNDLMSRRGSFERVLVVRGSLGILTVLHLALTVCARFSQLLESNDC